MSKSIRRLPSPALVVALVALVAALAGSAVALPGKDKVDRNDIRKNAVVSKQVKNDSITGADVNESTLAQVPSAAEAGHAKSADSADHAAAAQHSAVADEAIAAGHAGTATKLDNGVTVKTIFWRAAPNTSVSTHYNAEGLTLGLACDAVGRPKVTVSSGSNASELTGNTVSSGGANLTYSDDNGFTYLDIAPVASGSGTLTYSTANGAVVTMDYGFDSSPVDAGQTGCAFWATATDAPAQF